MVVDMGCAVKTFLGPADIQFLDNPAFGHDFKIAVHRAQADFGQTFPHHLIQYIGSGVRSNVAQFIKNNLALLGNPQAVIVKLRHGYPPQLIIILITTGSSQSQDFFWNS